MEIKANVSYQTGQVEKTILSFFKVKQDEYSNPLLNNDVQLCIFHLNSGRFYINLLLLILSTAFRKVLLSLFYRWENWNSGQQAGALQTKVILKWLN